MPERARRIEPVRETPPTLNPVGLRGLTSEQRDLFLRVENGVPLEAIAATSGKALGSVRTAYSRATASYNKAIIRSILDRTPRVSSLEQPSTSVRVTKVIDESAFEPTAADEPVTLIDLPTDPEDTNKKKITPREPATYGEREVQALRVLTPRERKIITSYDLLGNSLTDIMDIFGIESRKELRQLITDIRSRVDAEMRRIS